MISKSSNFPFKCLFAQFKKKIKYILSETVRYITLLVCQSPCRLPACVETLHGTHKNLQHNDNGKVSSDRLNIQTASEKQGSEDHGKSNFLFVFTAHTQCACPVNLCSASIHASIHPSVRVLDAVFTLLCLWELCRLFTALAVSPAVQDNGKYGSL